MEEAKGKEKVAKAEAKAAYEDTPKARENARIARADATYEVAKEKCDDLSGNAEGRLREGSQGRATPRPRPTPRSTALQPTRARTRCKRPPRRSKDAAEDKRDADYKVAAEKCDSLAGAAKDACVRDAKAKFGKT